MKVLFIIFIIIILLLLTKLKTEILYKRHNADDLFKITISWFKIFKHTFTVSFIDIFKNKEGFGFKLLLNIFGDQKMYISFESIYKGIKRLKKIYHLYELSFNDIFNNVRKNTTINKIATHIEFGILNPSITGIFTGVLYGIISNIYGFMSFVFTLNACKVDIIPRFNERLLKVEINCIFTTRIGNITYVMFRLFLILLFVNIKSFLYKFKSNIKVNIN